MFDFVCASEGFPFWIHVHPMRPQRRHVFTSLRHDIVSFATPTRRSGLERHGYIWVPTDLEAPVKWTRPIRSPIDLQVDPETLSTTPATLEDLGRPYPNPGRPTGLVTQASPLGRGTSPPVGP
jgi:hypothetical protein